MKRVLAKSFKAFSVEFQKGIHNNSFGIKMKLLSRNYDLITSRLLEETSQKIRQKVISPLTYKDVLRQEIQLAEKEYHTVHENFKNRLVPDRFCFSGSLMVPAFWLGICGPHYFLNSLTISTSVLWAG